MHSGSALGLSPGTLPVSHRCPLNFGLAIVDQLLAAIVGENDSAGLDAALDFRLLLASPHDPESVLRGFFRLREIIEDRHFLAHFRLRRWIESQIVARVCFDRCQPPSVVPLRLDCPSYSALYDRCVRDASASATEPTWARVRFEAAVAARERV